MMIKMNWSYWALLAVSWLLMTVVLADQSEASLTVDAGIRPFSSLSFYSYLRHYSSSFRVTQKAFKF